MADFSSAELAIIKKLGIKIQKVVEPEYKILRSTVQCGLCRTRTVQYFSLLKQGNTWTKDEELVQNSHVLKYDEVLNAKVSVCKDCEIVLGQMNKKTLINMLINRHAVDGPQSVRDEIQRESFKRRIHF